MSRNSWPPITDSSDPAATLPASRPTNVIEASHTDRQSTLLVRSDAPIHDPAWTVEQVNLEDLVLAYMRQQADGTRTPRALSAVPT
jgi:ABC-2 type transport system ATP-binding protein